MWRTEKPCVFETWRVTISVESWISNYGLFAVFLGSIVEGETVAITGGIMAHHHLLLPWQVASVAICGAYLSNLSVFFLGRRYRGQSRVQSILANKRLSGMLQKLNKKPARYASIFQFIPGMRIVGPIALAQSEIRTVQFALRAGISALIWGVVYTVLGSAVGQLLGRVFGHVLHTKYVLIAAGLVLSVIFLRAIWNHFRSASDH